MAATILYLNTMPGDRTHEMTLAGIHRDGAWGAFFLRGHGRHEDQRQCGLAYNHCCVDNLPRTFMDMASATVTADARGVFHVNLYQDATATLDGVTFAISGDYPVCDTVTVRVSRPVEVVFRKPAWCPRLDVSRDGDTWTLRFDMNPRVVHRPIAPAPEDEPARGTWAFDRYADNAPPGTNEDIRRSYRRTSAATVMRGPLVLARALRAGATRRELEDESTVNGLDCAVSLAPLPATDTWGLWDMTLTVPGRPPIQTRVCDFQSAGDDPVAQNANAFSIWL